MKHCSKLWPSNSVQAESKTWKSQFNEQRLQEVLCFDATDIHEISDVYYDDEVVVHEVVKNVIVDMPNVQGNVQVGLDSVRFRKHNATNYELSAFESVYNMQKTF